MRFDEALAKYGFWRLTRAHVSTNTWRGEVPGLEAFGRLVADTEVQDITIEDIDWWWDSLGYLADSTKATRLAQLRSFFRWAIDTGLRADDPTRLIRAPRVVVEPRDRLSAVELLGLLDLARTPRDRCLLALAMNLGLRGGEIQRLRWRDMHWRDETIRVRVDKTGEVDDMPVTYELLTELGVWAAQAEGCTPDSYLIPSQHIAPSGTVTYRHGQQVAEPFEVVKYVLDKAGWADTLQEGVHTIRRSVARLYFDKVEADESFDSALLATMTLLHHSRPETTLTYIGRDRATLARDRILKGERFLSAMTDRPHLWTVAS